MKIPKTKFSIGQRVWRIKQYGLFDRCRWRPSDNKYPKPVDEIHIKIFGDNSVGVSYWFDDDKGEFFEEDLFLTKAELQPACDSRNNQ